MRDYGISLRSVLSDPKPYTYWYDDFLSQQDKLVVVSGPAGVGKTTLVMNAMLSLAGGRSFMGKAYGGAAPCRFLYVDLDMGDEQVTRHFGLVARGMGLADADVDAMENNAVVLCDGMEPVPYGWDMGRGGRDLNVLHDLIVKWQPQHVVVESWLDLTGAHINTNEADGVNVALRLLRKCGAPLMPCFWIIHHEGKSSVDAAGHQKGALNRMLGSAALGKAATRAISIRQLRGVDRNGAWANVVEWGKVRTGPKPRNFVYTVTPRGEAGALALEYEAER